jgi:hypothetical protein
MCPYARRVSDFLFLVIAEMPWRALPYSWSWVSSSCVSIDKMITLLAWECSSYLYGPQKLEVHHHSTGPEHETTKMAWVDQGLQARSVLSSEKGKCSCRCAELQGSLQLFVSCTSYQRRVQHLSIAWLIIVQHHPHTHTEGWDHIYTEEWWWYSPHQKKNARRWPEGQLFLRGCERNLMVQGSTCCAKKRSTKEEDSGWSSYIKVLYSSGKYQDVSWPKAAILMDMNEAWDISLCVRVQYLQKGQGWLYET